MERKEITGIERPVYGGEEKTVSVEARMSYRDYELTRDLIIKVKQKEATEEEKRELLENYGENLEKIIPGENKSLKKITGPLNLTDRDPDTGITVVWKSDAPEIINEKGEVDLLRAEDRHKIELQALMTLDGITVTKTFQLEIDTNASGEDYEQSLNHSLQDAVNKASDDNTGRYLTLPGELDGGIRIRWFRGGKDDMTPLLLIFIIGMLTIYFKRYDRINREIKEAEESIIRDLPEFMNKLVLLLNAGMVVSSAFKKIAEDYEASRSGGSLPQGSGQKRALYEELCEIQKKVDQTNLSLIRELQEFSRRSGVRELVRMTAMISDNWNKGSLLAEKLEGESNLLWISRKKRAEEKGKLAETKLTFPLMLLLIVLIMVTIAPALMEM